MKKMYQYGIGFVKNLMPTLGYFSLIFGVLFIGWGSTDLTHAQSLTSVRSSSTATQNSIPEAFLFQGVARDLEGLIMAEQEMTLRISILKGSENGESVYQEFHQIITNASGYFSIAIGEGQSVSGSSAQASGRSSSGTSGNSSSGSSAGSRVGKLSQLDWTSAPHYILYEVDMSGSGQYEPLGTTRLLSVPYAMVAGSVTSGLRPEDFPELSRIAFSGDSLNGSVLIATDQGLLLEKTVAIGESALSEMRGGSSNTAIGFEALKGARSGSGNTAVGANSGVSDPDLENTTAIGAGAVVSESNQIQLGNDAVGLVITAGRLQAGEVIYPNRVGASGQILASDGTGQLVWKEDKTGIDYRAGGALKLSEGEFSIADGGVTSSLIADSAVTSAKLADGAVTSAKLTDGAVTSAKLAEGIITRQALAPGVIDLINDSTPQLGGDLDVNGRAIITSNGADLILRPDAGGQLILDSLRLPQSDGVAGQVLATNGSGQLTWQTTQIPSYTAGSGLILSGNQFSIATGISDLVNDATPQLGGNLDVNGQIITSSGNGDILLDPAGSGQVVISNMRFPNLDGGGGQVLSTDGNGNLRFINLNGTTQIISNEFIYDRLNFESSLLLGDTTLTGTLNDARMNVGIGSATFNALTEGDYNVAIGRNLLPNLTTGFGNVYLGGSYYPENLGAGETKSQLTTGALNIGIGIGAMENITTQRSNIGIGLGAGKGATDGNSNIFLGEEAGFGLGLDHTKAFAPSDGNVVIGRQARISAKAGIEAAVAIGRQADAQENYAMAMGTESMAMGLTSIALGYKAEAMAANSIALGSEAKATSANTVVLGNTSIDSVLTSGLLKLGDVVYPNTDGSSGHVLTTNGAGSLSFAGVSSAMITDGSISSDDLANASVTTAKLANASVNSSILADSTVTLAKLAISGTPTAGQLLTFDGTDLTFSSVGGSNYTAGTGLALSGSQFSIANNGVTAAQIADSTITGSKIVRNSLSLGNLQNVVYDSVGLLIGTTQHNGSASYPLYNILLGESAFSKINFAEYNIAIGMGSPLENIEDGWDNVAIGTAAMKGDPSAPISGANNIAMGWYTLGAISSGSDNIAMGSMALRGLTTGSSNIALGSSALNKVTATDYNIGIGNNAGFHALGGADNIFVGRYAGGSSDFTPGDHNIVLGAYNNLRVDGIENTILMGNLSQAFGSESISIGKNTYVNSRSVALGAEAMVDADSSIAIGYGAKARAQNAIAIGTGAQSTSANTIVLGNNDISAVTTSGTLTLGAVTYPKTHGSAGQVLTTSGSGTLTWQSVSSGSSYTAGTGLSLTSNTFSVATGGISETLLADGAVTGNKLGSGSVTTTKIVDASVTTGKIADANITTAKIADGNVTTAKIADANITTTKLADVNVTTAKIADANITTDKLANASVTSAKLADSTITLSKLAITGTPTAGQSLTFNGTDLTFATVTSGTNYTAGTGLTLTSNTFSVATGGIAETLLADGAVTGNKLGSGSVTTTKIADTNVTTDKIADANITTAKLADANVTTAKLANSSVTSAKLDTSLTISGAFTARAFVGDGSGLTNIPTVSSLGELNEVYFDETDGDLIIGYTSSRTSTGTTGTIAIGKNALSRFNGGSTSKNNIGIGVEVGGTGMGGNNILMGYRSGYSLNGGSRNIFLGLQAGYNTSGGSGNIALGEEAGYNLGGNANNILIGYQAGKGISSSFTSTSNVIIGYAAASVQIPGDNNVILGSSARVGSQSVNQSVILGYQAMGGTNGISIGYLANTTNITNAIAIGYQSSATGDDAIAIGQNTLSSTPNSIVIGKNSGNNGYSNVIILGSDRKASANNTLYLGGSTITSVVTNGTVVANNQTLTSDRRLKRNLEPLSNATGLLSSLTPYHYQKKRTLSSTEYNIDEIGLIAQDVQKILPFLVSESAGEDRTLTLDYNSFIGLLIKAHQEQEDKITLYESELENQRTTIEKQQRQLEAQQTILQQVMNRLETLELQSNKP